MEKYVIVQRPNSRHCLFSKSGVLISAMVVTLLSAGCTGNISGNHQSVTERTPYQITVKDNKGASKFRRTRERQGTTSDDSLVSARNENNLPALKIGIIPTQSRTEQERMIQPLDKHLEQSLGRQVDFQIAKDYEEVVNWLVQNKLDMAYLGSMTYLEAVERGAKVEPLVASIDKHTGQPWYRACIIVKANSPIKTLKDLKGKRVAFVDKSSTSGYLMLLVAFKKLGIYPQADFSQILYAGNHSKSIAALEEGIADAAATNISSYLKYQKSSNLISQNSRILWKSAPIPQFLIVVSKRLPLELIYQLKRAFISTPDGIEDILGAESAGYTLVSPGDYADIQQLRKDFNLISIPAK